MGRIRWIRASEINAYGYCARGWWLQYVMGLEPEDHGQFVAGEQGHLAHGRRVLRAETFRRIAWAVLVLGLLLAVVALVFFLQGG